MWLKKQASRNITMLCEIRLRRRYLFLFEWAVISILLGITGGCASSSVFSPYPNQMTEIKTDVERRSFSTALKTLDKNRNSADKTLYMLERGRISQLQGDAKASIEDFALAMRTEAAADEKARISASDTAAKGAALLTNDNAIPYRASSYERVMMHHYQAINYLMQSDVEGAGVEIRRAALEQSEALERHHKEIANAEKAAREKNYNPALHRSQVNQHFEAMYTAAGEVKNSFQNAYTFYLSGVIYELLGEPNDAYIDYKKAFEIFPNNTVLQRDLLRLSKALGFSQDYEQFSARFSASNTEISAVKGELVILYEEGYVPLKEEVAIPIGTRNTIHTVAFPIYRDLSRQAGALSLSSERGFIANTSLICDFRALAAKDLQEKIPAMMIRQVLRLVTKDSMRKTAGDNFGAVGSIASIIFNVVSERADRRSWLTLPRTAQILRTRLPVGQQLLTLSSSTGGRDQISVNIRADKISLIHVVRNGSQWFVNML